MEWTTNPPTKDGWFYRYSPWNRIVAIEYWTTQASYPNSPGYVCGAGTYNPHAGGVQMRSLEPIPLPEPPEEEEHWDCSVCGAWGTGSHHCTYEPPQGEE